MTKIAFIHPYEWAARMLDEEFVNKMRFTNDGAVTVSFDMMKITFRVIGRSDDGTYYVVNTREEIPDWVREKLELDKEDK